jgi:hypothetical protein
MKKILTILGSITLMSVAYADEQIQSPAPYRSFNGQYAIYSGALGEQQAPTRRDHKISLIVKGQVAKDMFDAMQSDDKETCSGEKGARSRSKENVWCTFGPGEGYACYFGFDLHTGKSIGGGIC